MQRRQVRGGKENMIVYPAPKEQGAEEEARTSSQGSQQARRDWSEEFRDQDST